MEKSNESERKSESEQLHMKKSGKSESNSESEQLHLGKISERIAATVPPIGRPEENHSDDDEEDAFDYPDDRDEYGFNDPDYSHVARCF